MLLNRITKKRIKKTQNSLFFLRGVYGRLGLMVCLVLCLFKAPPPAFAKENSSVEGIVANRSIQISNRLGLSSLFTGTYAAYAEHLNEMTKATLRILDEGLNYMTEKSKLIDDSEAAAAITEAIDDFKEKQASFEQSKHLTENLFVELRTMTDKNCVVRLLIWAEYRFFQKMSATAELEALRNRMLHELNSYGWNLVNPILKNIVMSDTKKSASQNITDKQNSKKAKNDKVKKKQVSVLEQPYDNLLLIRGTLLQTRREMKALLCYQTATLVSWMYVMFTTFAVLYFLFVLQMRFWHPVGLFCVSSAVTYVIHGLIKNCLSKHTRKSIATIREELRQRRRIKNGQKAA